MRYDVPEPRVETRPDIDASHQAALLIDFDNVTMGIRSNLGQELRNLLNSDVIRGKVAVQRAYADWRRYPQYIVPLSEASIDLIFAPAYGSSKKNATDIRLAIDALELVFIRPEIKTFILMSGDSDFSSLVLKLKEYGKYIIGVGIQESSSDLLVQNCDEYYSYSALSGLSKTGDQPLESHDPWVLTEKAIAKMVERGDTMRSDRLKQVMLEIDPSYNEKEQGFNKFNRFVVEAASRGLLSIQKMENGQYGVAPPKGGDKAPKDQKEEKRESKPRRGEERRGREPTRGRDRAAATDDSGTQRARPKLTMKSALDLLDQALRVLMEGGADSVRDSDVKRKLLEIDPAFDEGELGYSKFSKFLQAAEADGAVVLERGPQGNYHVGFGKGKRRAKPKPRDASETETSGETKMRKLARFLFGSSKDEDEEKPPEPEAPKAQSRPGPKAEPRATERRGRSRPSTPAARKGARTTKARGGESPARGTRGGRSGGRSPQSESGERGARRESQTEARSPRSPGREPRSGQDRRRGGGPKRQESRPTPKSEPKTPVIEPAEAAAPQLAGAEPPAEPVREASVVEKLTAAVAESRAPVAEVPSRPEADRGPQEEKVAEPAPTSKGPRGGIRGRRGSRGRSLSAEGPPPILEGQARKKPGQPAPSARADDGEARARSKDAGDVSLVARLTGYPGVGGRTAEALVDAFGDDLFRILDEEPGRVRELLSDHRAERVLEGRRKELEAGGK